MMFEQNICIAHRTYIAPPMVYSSLKKIYIDMPYISVYRGNPWLTMVRVYIALSYSVHGTVRDTCFKTQWHLAMVYLCQSIMV